MNKLSSLPNDVRATIEPYFQVNNGSEVDEVEVDQYYNVVSVGYKCTKQNCNCVGGWRNSTGFKAIGDTKTISK